MGKVYRAVAVVLLVFGWSMSAMAQTSQPPSSSQTVQTQPDNTAPGQIQSQDLSPETQMELVKKIRHAILMLPYYGVFDTLGFRLQGRTVILEGQVLRSSLKPDAQKAVEKIEGVDKVVNSIEVLPPGPIDMSIRRQVQAAIYEYPPFLKYSNQPIPPIRIIVKNARVTLVGVVDTETDKNLCTMRVNQVSDVLSATNNLQVIKAQPAKPPKSSDSSSSKQGK